MDNKEKKSMRIAVIGAGISGMSAAWEIVNSGETADIYERDAVSGGLAGWFDVGGTTLEKFYHHLYNKDEDLINLINEAGLGESLVFKNTATSCFHGNRIYRLSSPLDLLRYKPLSFMDRIRLGMLVLKARLVKDWRDLDSISVKDWVVGIAGENVFKVLWEPLLRSKFGRYGEQVSAAWLWSKMVQRGGSRSKGGAEELGYLKGGYGLLFKRLEKLLTERGAEIHFETPVEKILIKNNKVEGLQVNGKPVKYDAVLATAQVPDYLNIADDLPEGNKKALEKIGFLGNVCLVLKMKRRLSDTYWLNITESDCPFVGVIEQTNLLSEDNYQGHHLVYLSRYMDVDDPYYGMNAEQLFKEYLPSLKKIYPEFSEDWTEEIMLWREPHAQPVVSVGYKDMVPEADAPVQGLYLSTMAQIFPEDRQMSNGVKIARKTARLLLKNLKH